MTSLGSNFCPVLRKMLRANALKRIKKQKDKRAMGK